jgi:hypothetical protein
MLFAVTLFQQVRIRFCLGVNYNYLFSVLIVVFGTCRYEFVLLFWLLTVFSALPSISYLLHCLI